MLTPELKRQFPLCSLDDVLQLFRKQLQLPEPNLTLLSIVSGFLESTLISRFNDNQSGTAEDTLHTFPLIEWDYIEELYKKFQAILSVIVEPPAAAVGNANVKKQKQSLLNATPTPTAPLIATREIIKRVSDLIWHSLIRSTYKDRAHLQSLFSYLTSNKLDCFGVAFAVVAGCQLLGYPDVNLAISEDHAWVVFGGSANNGSRETIEVTWHGKGFEDKRGESVGIGVDSQSWLYLSGHSVVCDRFMEVSALVLAINPSLNLTSACLEVTELQKRLLWMLYEHGHLKKYPMGLGNLGELEEFAPSSSVEGGEKQKPTSEELYRQSVRSARKWHQNYHVYPYTYQGSYYYRKIMYREAFAAWADAGDVIRRYIYSRDDEEIYKELLDIANEQIPSIMKTESSGHSARSILRDPNCFANLLRFYDGICKWEEGSLTPILHIGWAKPLVTTIGKFDYDIRSQVIIATAADDEEIPEVKDDEEDEGDGDKGKEEGKPTTAEDNNNSIRTTNHNNNNNNNNNDLPPTLAALTAACGVKLLNPNFLTGGEVQPFTSDVQKQATEEVVVGATNEVKQEIVAPVVEEKKESPLVVMDDHRVEDDEPKRPEIKLYSQKMKGLKSLLLAEKLNTQAILLQMTAQSQVGAGKKSSRGGWNANESSTTGSSKDESATGGGGAGGVGNSSGNTGSALGDSGEGAGLTSSGRPKRARRE